MLRFLIPLLFLPTLGHASDRDQLLMALPAGGIRFATSGSGSDASKTRFVIGQVDNEGLRILTEENHSDYSTFIWLDDRTLVAAGIEQGKPFTQRYVDGKRSGERVSVPPDAWAMQDKAADIFVVDLFLDKKKGLWLGTCFDFRDDMTNTCIAYRALALDSSGAVKALSKAVPKGASFPGDTQRGTAFAKLPRLKPPQGYTIKFHKTDITDGSAMIGDGRKVPAFTCTGPNGSSTWPSVDVTNWEFLTRPKAVRWVKHEPPLYVVTGPATNPIAQTAPSAHVFSGCSRQALEEVVFAPHDLWFERRSELDGVIVTGSHWVAMVGPHELGKFPGDWNLVIAPSH